VAKPGKRAYFANEWETEPFRAQWRFGVRGTLHPREYERNQGYLRDKPSTTDDRLNGYLRAGGSISSASNSGWPRNLSHQGSSGTIRRDQKGE